MNDKHADPSARIRAAELMFNRVVGRPKEHISLDVTKQAAHGSAGSLRPSSATSTN